MSFLEAAAVIVGKLAIATLFGFALLRSSVDGLSRLEKFAWAVGLAVLVDAAAALTSTLLGRPDPFWLVAAGAAAMLLLRRRSLSPARPPAGPLGWINGLLFALSVAGLIAFSLAAISEPLWTNDYLAIWGLKAKAIALTHAVPRDFLRDPSCGYAHPEYPLGLPLLMASVSWSRWNDHALAIVFPIFAVASVAAIAGFSWRRSSARGAAVAAALAGLFFPLFRASNVGLADIPFALAAVLLATAFLDTGEGTDLRPAVRLAVAAMLACLLKREGSLLAVVFASAAVAAPWERRAKRRALAALLLPAAGAVSLQGALLGFSADRDFQGAARLMLGHGDFPARLWRVVQSTATEIPATGALGLAALALFFAVTPRVRADCVVLPIAAQAAIYAVACAFYAGDPAFLVHTALPRIVSALLPVLTLAIGARAAAVFRNSSALG